MIQNILEIKQLSKSYGQVKAVDGIDLTCQRGTLFAFLGLNGAGKSTTINIICTLLAKDSGKVYVAGYDIDSEPDKVRKSIGVVFQGSVLDKALTVQENLSLRAKLYIDDNKLAKTRIEELCELLDLKDLKKRQYGRLSGGQRRRVDVARALIGNPELLILDEPTTGLDPQTRKGVWDIIENLRRTKNLSVFLTTHYMEEANRADQVVILDGGRIVAEGTPSALKSQYSGDYLYIYAPRDMENDRIFGTYGGAFDAGRYVIKLDNPEQAKSILYTLDRYIKDFEVIKGDMDDVFLNVTGKKLSGGEFRVL